MVSPHFVPAHGVSLQHMLIRFILLFFTQVLVKRLQTAIDRGTDQLIVTGTTGEGKSAGGSLGGAGGGAGGGADAAATRWLRCARCKEVYYCNRKCQTQHWKSGGHKAACHSIKGGEEGEEGKEGKEEEGDEASLGMFAVPTSEKMACASRKLEAQRMLLQTVEDYVAAKSGTYVYKTPEYATHDSGDSDDSFGGYGGGGEGGFAADFGEDLMNRPSFEDGDSDDSDPMGCDDDDY